MTQYSSIDNSTVEDFINQSKGETLGLYILPKYFSKHIVPFITLYSDIIWLIAYVQVQQAVAAYKIPGGFQIIFMVPLILVVGSLCVFCWSSFQTKKLLGIAMRLVPPFRSMLMIYGMRRWGIFTKIGYLLAETVSSALSLGFMTFVYITSQPGGVLSDFVISQPLNIAAIATNSVTFLLALYSVIVKLRKGCKYYDDFGVMCRDQIKFQRLAKYRGSPRAFKTNGFRLKTISEEEEEATSITQKAAGEYANTADVTEGLFHVPLFIPA